MRVKSTTAYAVAMLLLTGTCGLLDAVSFLALDRVFTGNMTGNVLFIGFGLAGVDEIPVLNNAVALCSFMVGAAIASRLTKRSRANTQLPGSSVVIVGAATAVTYGVGFYWLNTDSLSELCVIVVTGLLAFVLGSQAAAVSGLGIREFSTVVVTMTVVSLAADSRFGSPAEGTPQARRIAVVLSMAAGAAIGALMWRAHEGPVALLLGAAVMTVGLLIISWARYLERIH